MDSACAALSAAAIRWASSTVRPSDRPDGSGSARSALSPPSARSDGAEAPTGTEPEPVNGTVAVTGPETWPVTGTSVRDGFMAAL